MFRFHGGVKLLLFATVLSLLQSATSPAFAAIDFAANKVRFSETKKSSHLKKKLFNDNQPVN
jgi:hypothetical protein